MSAASSASKLAASASRLPTFFMSHGGGPCFFMTSEGEPFQHMDKNSKAAAWYRDFARREGLADGDRKPRALLIVSAHWEASPVRVMTSARPSLLFDYHGFPKHTYELEYPCAGAPDVAARVRTLLTGAGIASADDAKRGLDHGVFVPLLLMYPAADIPTLQLSLDASLSAAEHLRIGRALQPLRDEGVLIIGSGFITHDLSFRLRADQAHSFTDAVAAALVGDAKQQSAKQAGGGDAQSQREAALERWESMPAARAAHPREEHLLPLMVAAAAAGSADRETRVTRMGQNLAPAPLLFDSYRFD